MGRSNMWSQSPDGFCRARVVRVEEQAGARRGEGSWLLVEPADPLVEATRRALELGIPVACADAWSPDYPSRREAAQTRLIYRRPPLRPR